MANVNEGRREVVSDPLAPNAREQRADRSLQIQGIRQPATPSAASLESGNPVGETLGQIEGILAQEFEKKKDGWITEGKIAFQSGVTEADMLKQGNRFTEQGWRTLQARDQVNQWYVNGSIALDQGDEKIAPQEYAATLKQQRDEVLKNISDPHARKVASAAFEDMSPRLAQAQTVKNNEYNRKQRVNEFTNVLASTGQVSANGSRQAPGEYIPLTPAPVTRSFNVSAEDRDIGIRTMIGEAGNQGVEGLAAVAHVLGNRASDPRFPSTIGAVAKQKKQFSSWNEDGSGNGGVNISPDNPIYQRAAQIFDGVMSGRHVDPTGGATHFYSPAGMKKLVADGYQKNELPAWLDAERKVSGGEVKIGGHVFVGRSAGRGLVVPANEGETALSLQAEKGADLNQPAAAEGVANESATKVGGTEVQQMILGMRGLNDTDKATAVADAMRRRLDAGDETLFRDAGGVAMLQRLGAKPNEIDEVQKARTRFEHKQLTSFDVEREKFRDDVMAKAEGGASRDEVLGMIEERRKASLLDDTHARSIAHAAVDKVRQLAGAGKKSQFDNPDMLQELGGLYQRIQAGQLDFKTATQQATDVAKMFGANDADIKNIIGTMFNYDQQHQKSVRAAAEKAVLDKQKQDAAVDTVARTLARGYGLGDLPTDKIKIGDKEVTMQDFGVEQVRRKWSEQYQKEVEAGRLTVEKASELMMQKFTLELQQHNVVDKLTENSFHGTLTGNILDPKSPNGLKKEAYAAYRQYQALKQTPGIESGYIAKVVPDNNTRTLLETAFMLDNGNLSGPEAIKRAHELLHDPNYDPKKKIERDGYFDAKLKQGITKTLMDRTDPGFFARMFGTADRSEQERVLSQNKVAENYVMKQAEIYQKINDREHPDVSVEKALQDLQRNAVPVMGNLLISSPGKEIDAQMGIKGNGYGKDAVNEAVTEFIRKRGPTLWGKDYTDRDPWFTSAVRTGASAYMAGVRPLSAAIDAFQNKEPSGEKPKSPPMLVTYNEASGTITVSLYKDQKRGEIIGTSQPFSVRAIGEEYKKTVGQPTAMDRAWNSMFKGAMQKTEAQTYY